MMLLGVYYESVDCLYLEFVQETSFVELKGVVKVAAEDWDFEIG